MPKVDLLIVDEIGKNISGTGMDPNVTGRGTGVFMKTSGGEAPAIKRLLVRSLTEASGGNATGIGFADMTTMRCADQIDFGYTYTNTITSIELDGSKLPVVCNSDREAIVVGLRTCQGGEAAGRANRLDQEHERADAHLGVGTGRRRSQGLRRCPGAWGGGTVSV